MGVGHGQQEVGLGDLGVGDAVGGVGGDGDGRDARDVVGADAVAGLGQDAAGPGVDGVATFLVGDAGGGDGHAARPGVRDAGGGEAVAQDDLGHGGAADVAGAHHDDPIGASTATAGQHGGRSGGGGRGGGSGGRLGAGVGGAHVPSLAHAELACPLTQPPVSGTCARRRGHPVRAGTFSRGRGHPARAGTFSRGRGHPARAGTGFLSPTASNAPVRKDTHPAAQNVPAGTR